MLMGSDLRSNAVGFRIVMRNIPPTAKSAGAGFELRDAAIMLQEFMPQGRPKERLGAGASVSFMCENALALYREFKSRGVQTRSRPFVGTAYGSYRLLILMAIA